MAESTWADQDSLTERVSRLYIAHREEIYRFLVRQGLSPTMAQDVTQEVFVQLLVTLREGVTINSELLWMYRVAANRAVDHWRRDRRLSVIELDGSTFGLKPSDCAGS